MKTFFRISLITTLMLTFAACQLAPAPPAESDETISDVESGLVEITTENITSLIQVYSASISDGYIHVKWTADSTAYWIENGEQAVLYNSASNKKVAEFAPGEYTAVYDVSSDGETIAYSQDGTEIHLFHAIDQTDILTIVPDFPFRSAFFNRDGSLLGVPSMMDLKVVVFNVESGMEVDNLRGYETAAPAYGAKFGDDGETLLWFSRGTVQPMDITSGKMGPTLSHEDFVSAEDLSPDGNVVVTTAAGMVGGEYQPILTLWDADSGEILRQIAIPTYFSSIAFSPDSKLIAAGTEESVLIFTSPHGDEVFNMRSDAPASSMAFSPDGTRLAVCGNAGTLTIYAVE